MASLNMFYYKSICIAIFAFIGNANLLFAQGNCLIYPEGSGEREACELCYSASEFRQGSKASQAVFDQAIKVGPKYAWAYYQKSVPYFKRGLLADGIKLINKAIELEPQNYLYYRAYWYFYNRSYKYCIKDLEELYTTHQAFYTTTPGGDLEMRLLLAMAYAHTGDIEKGIYWINNLMTVCKDRPNLKGYYDHFCLGVLYFKNNQNDLAKTQFEKQLAVDDGFADTYYYLGLISENESQNVLAQGLYKQAMARMNGEHNGHSINLFTEYNIDKKDLLAKL